MIYEWILNLWVFVTSLGILILSLIFVPYAYDQIEKRLRKNKFTELEGKLEEAEIERSLLNDWKLKAKMIFSVINKKMKQAEAGYYDKSRLIEFIRNEISNC